MPGILNPLLAACDQGFVPDRARILSNPGVADAVSIATSKFEAIGDVYDGDIQVTQTELDAETDFADIVGFYREAITTAHDNGDRVAVDVTPGRKFMSAIAFQAGFQYDADHIYYFHRNAGGYYGQFYPEMPRTATDLIDFTEVI